VKRRYAGIPQPAIDIYIYMCDACQTRRSIPKPACGKPILSVGFLTTLQLGFNRAKIILELKSTWSDLIIINGRPRHLQSQGLVERANTVVQKMLGSVMLAINNCVSQSTQKTPYEMVFGQSVHTNDEFCNTTQSSHKKIRDEAEKCYILTA
ncbi:unnamed protein product, partial [Rotaria magnacalcarata]